MVSLEIPRLQLDENGTPVSSAYGDVYHSVAGGHAQALHVFLAGNDLPRRWQGQSRFVILETGFGLGLNFLASWQVWRNDPLACDELEFVSLEKHPFAVEDLALAQAAWPEFSELGRELRAHWPPLVAGEHVIRLAGGRVVLRLVFGDALTLLPTLEAQADAFYLDGFSPSKNPEMWSPALFAQLAGHARPGASLATWSVAGAVRQGLRDAGFSVEKKPGFGGKRQRLVGFLR